MIISNHDIYLLGLPVDWQQISIEQLGSVFAGGTPSRTSLNYWNGTIAWVTPSELTQLESKWLTKTREYITEAGLTHSGAILLPKGSLLVTTRATIGSVAIAATELSTNQGFKNIVPNSSSTSLFYYYLLSFITPEMVRLASGSTFDEISRKDFVGITVPRPPMQEQRCIAHILDTIDTQIQETERLIAKLKHIKVGLLHDLLTRGIDEHGDVRDPIKHPEQFKDSALGRIPKFWILNQLKDVISSPITDFGSFSMTNLLDFRNSGIPFLRTEARQDYGIDLSQLTFISEEVHKQLPKSVVYSGDVLFTKIGASLGRVCVYDGTLGECNSNAASAKIRINSRKMNNHFIAHYLRSQMAKDQYLRDIISVPPRINLGEINALKIPVPQLDEQNLIVKALNSHDSRIASEEAALEKLRQVKRGLMHDLLTGHVRVNAAS